MNPARFHNTIAPASSLAVGPCAWQSEQETSQYGTAFLSAIKDESCSNATTRLPPQKMHGFIFGTAALLLLSACATPGIPPPPQIVNVPVPVSCLPAVLPQRPKTATDTELAALDDYKFPLAIFLDRRTLLDYTAELEAILSACK